MTDADFVEHWALVATWSIKEAAYLVNNIDPRSANIKISETSTSPVSKAYYWLIKEYKKEELVKVGGTDDEPRFSPGTLLRHLETYGGFRIPPRLKHTYEKQGRMLGPHKLNLQAVYAYREAATLIWMKYPWIRVSDMADLLTTLPSYMESSVLSPRSAATIRNYLKRMSPTKPGRPPKDRQGMPNVDLAAIAKKI